MKTKLITLALFGLMSISFMSCTEEEVAPINDITTEEARRDCVCEGGLSEREDPTKM